MDLLITIAGTIIGVSVVLTVLVILKTIQENRAKKELETSMTALMKEFEKTLKTTDKNSMH